MSQPPCLSPGLGFCPGGAWWTTTSSTTWLAIHIDVTNNGGSTGSVFDLCVRRALWKRKSVWPDGGPASLKGSFLTIWAKQHSWLDWPELITEREEGIYMVFICVGICPAYAVRLSFPMNSLHVQINTHTFHNLQILKILSNICFCHNRHDVNPHPHTHTHTHTRALPSGHRDMCMNSLLLQQTP